MFTISAHISAVELTPTHSQSKTSWISFFLLSDFYAIFSVNAFSYFSLRLSLPQPKWPLGWLIVALKLTLVFKISMGGNCWSLLCVCRIVRVIKRRCNEASSGRQQTDEIVSKSPARSFFKSLFGVLTSGHRCSWIRCVFANDFICLNNSLDPADLIARKFW